MKIIYTTNNDAIMVDDEDYPLLIRHKWFFTGKRVECKLANDSRRFCIPISRIIMGPAGSGFVWDHINNKPLDNRKENYRRATHQRNKLNQRNNRTGFKGVIKSRCKHRPFAAQINANKQHRYLGSFFTAEDAARAYDKAAIESFGPGAVLNFSVSQFLSK